MKLTAVAAWLITADILPEEERTTQLAELLSQVAERIRVTKWNITQEVKRGDLPARMSQPILNNLLAELKRVTSPELQAAKRILSDYITSTQVTDQVAQGLEELLGSRAPLYAAILAIEKRAPLLSASAY